MQTGDHSDSIPVSVPNVVDCTTSSVTTTSTVVVAPQASGNCDRIESNLTNGMFFFFFEFAWSLREF
ncbi:hypothetical protein ACH3XW_10030 [Acanthocheilonema viteae]